MIDLGPIPREEAQAQGTAPAPVLNINGLDNVDAIGNLDVREETSRSISNSNPNPNQNQQNQSQNIVGRLRAAGFSVTPTRTTNTGPRSTRTFQTSTTSTSRSNMTTRTSRTDISSATATSTRTTRTSIRLIWLKPVSVRPPLPSLYPM